MSNPYLDRIAKRGKTGHGRVYEKAAAKSLGARLHANSGAGNKKSDASTEDFRFEMKTTRDGTLKVDYGWLTKITNEARVHDQHPALCFAFVNGEGKPLGPAAEWVAIPKRLFQELMEK